MIIHIEFEVECRRYEAVGFLNKGESSVDGVTMLSRTAGENGGAIGEESETFLSKRRSKFPKELRKYYLVTGRRNHGNPRNVLYFHWDVDRWYQSWYSLDRQWDGGALVLRRCA